MKGIDRYYDDYNPDQLHVPPVYREEYFPANLKELLRQKNLTQAAAAELCGVDPPMISYWLNGKQLPSLPTFARICAGLEIEPNWLLAKHQQIKRKKDANENEKSTMA